ncbi:MAG: hypothetical protein HKL90_09130 [Elusimicrobia bacterium]|nr:hypothetical protein [Elusimicrobiota bacterium]
MGQPVKLADELILDARLMGKVGRRSIAGQIEFWAQLGEALEPLLQGIQVLALLKSRGAKPLSVLLDSVDSSEGRRRVIDHLKSRPFPHYEPAPRRPGLLLRTQADGSRTIGRFVRRHFTPVS